MCMADVSPGLVGEWAWGWLWTECLCPPKMYMVKPNPMVMVLGAIMARRESP